MILLSVLGFSTKVDFTTKNGNSIVDAELSTDEINIITSFGEMEFSFSDIKSIKFPELKNELSIIKTVYDESFSGNIINEEFDFKISINELMIDRKELKEIINKEYEYKQPLGNADISIIGGYDYKTEVLTEFIKINTNGIEMNYPLIEIENIIIDDVDEYQSRLEMKNGSIIRGNIITKYIEMIFNGDNREEVPIEFIEDIEIHEEKKIEETIEPTETALEEDIVEEKEEEEEIEQIINDGSLILKYPKDEENVEKGKVTLEWDGEGKIFYVYFGRDNLECVGLTDKKDFEVEVSEYDTEYKWRIETDDEFFNVIQSEEKSFKTVKNKPPSKPVLISPENYSVGVNYYTNFEWECSDPDGDELTYTIHIKERMGDIIEKVTNDNTIEINLTGNTGFQWWIEVEDTYDNKQISDKHTFATEKSVLQDIEMVHVIGGTFIMGNEYDDSNEKTSHEVTLTYDFYIGRYEVTFNLYDKYCDLAEKRKTSTRGWGRNERPVIFVNWYDAINFCNWLSETVSIPKAYDNIGNLLDTEGNITKDITKVVGYRLPTEAEWEFAAKGGVLSKEYMYSGSDDINQVAWISKNSEGQTHEVGTRVANELGIYDMSGNVWEWCNDWYSFSYYSSSPIQNPVGPDSGSSRIIRGACYSSGIYEYPVSYRDSYYISNSFSGLGFRICKTKSNY